MPSPRGLWKTMVEPPSQAARSFARPIERPRLERGAFKGTLAYAPEPERGQARVVGVPTTRDGTSRATPEAPASSRATLEAPAPGLAARLATLGMRRPTVLPPEGTREHEPFGARERFEVIKRLGGGGMGEVALAHDNDLGRNVAIKRAHDDAPVDRFVDEIRTLGHLDHPNIAPLHDVGMDEDGRYFFVMRHVEGETLDAIIARLRARDPEAERHYTFERRIEIVLGLLHALEHTHAIGILHRDLKPENVMIGRHGEVQLMDWGVAVPFDATSVPTTKEPRGIFVGTPWNMSPEQARGEADLLDARSDLYAVGVLFHELLTLEHYLGDEARPEVVMDRVARQGWRNALVSWHRGPGPMPPMELFHFVRRAMAYSREERFANAAEMIAELHRILDGRVRVQCPITLVKSSTRQAGRFVDRAPWTSFALFSATVTMALYGVASAIAGWM